MVSLRSSYVLSVAAFAVLVMETIACSDDTGSLATVAGDDGLVDSAMLDTSMPDGAIADRSTTFDSSIPVPEAGDGPSDALTPDAPADTGTASPEGGALQDGSSPSVQIVSGDQWYDNNHINVQGHGGNIIKVGSLYYWIGEDRTDQSWASCSSSPDLVHWTSVGHLLPKQASGDLGPDRIVERPRVIFNKSTSQYVMYFHADASGYTDPNVGVATSSSVCGTYQYLGKSQPLGNPSYDENVFQDDDGSAYLLSTENGVALNIDALSSDYLTVLSRVASLDTYEGPAIFKVNGTYYLLGSHLTGWSSNDNQYTTATSLSGPWATWQGFAPSGTNTFNSQTMFVLPVAGTQSTTFIFMGDRWTPSHLADSSYVWLPLQVAGTSLSVSWYGRWSLDQSTGTWSGTPAEIASGSRYKFTSYSSGYVLHAAGAARGTSAIQSTDKGDGTEMWRVTCVGSSCQIQDPASSLVLAAAAGSAANGAGVVLAAADSTDVNQQWQLVDRGDGYYKVQSVANGYVLDNDDSMAPGTNIVQWSDNGGENQGWELILDSGP